ncbi:MAG: cob(I)yrinic acid a,c-diamide adenosyltransferase [Candidatus Omnitrophica bacterium]|nr:cob(I)yrinic acid a,c-diamide adenosyltransferase [Candidatus Omnitrophota bacterium]
MVHFYLGDGKGKTTAALGLALRAIGVEKKVYIAQFLKDKNVFSAEIFAVEKFNFPIKIERFKHQTHPFFLKRERFNRKLLRESVREALSKVEEYIEKRKFDLIVLDEILNAVMQKFCSKALLKRIIKQSSEIELILTGRSAPSDLIELADYVSFIKNMKHPFYRNISARKGIDY